MAPQQVVEQVKRKDWGVIDTPGQIGRDAGPALVPLLDSRDAGVRELAIYALDAAGGTPAAQGMVKALDDPSETVRDAALRFLERHAGPAELPALEKEVSSSHDEYLRGKVALIIGKIGQARSVAPLQARYAIEPHFDTKREISLALARLGDPVGREAVTARLRQPDPAKLAQAVTDLVYVNDPKLLAEAAPLLDDTRDAQNVGPSHGPLIIRVCDVVVGVMDEMLRHPFSFPVSRTRRYTPEELAQAKSVLAGLR